MKLACSLAVVLAAGFSITGCQSMHDHEASASVSATPVVVNSHCPIGREEIDPAVETVTYKGVGVGFCCAGCRELWPTLSDAERDEFVAKARKGAEERVGG